MPIAYLLIVLSDYVCLYFSVISSLQSDFWLYVNRIAGSDPNSVDFMYFNVIDDSSYFDGNSLFADSLEIVGDNDSAFSTNSFEHFGRMKH